MKDLLKPVNYKERLVDAQIEKYLSLFGAISIEGPKWCGKTWTGLSHSRNVAYLDDENTRNIASIDSDYILNKEMPILLDEWTFAPYLWDKVRRKCDENKIKGKYILTCSTELDRKTQNEKIFHSGAGRIASINMSTMSLYESGDSSGKVSLTSLRDGIQNGGEDKERSLVELSYILTRGGWPENIDKKDGEEEILPEVYIQSILNKDINDVRNRNGQTMLRILKCFARNISTYASNSKIQKDIENIELKEVSRGSLDDYIDVLYRLHILEDQIAYTENCRSHLRIGKMAKRHFCDPSLAVSLLGLNGEKLINDLKTFGLLFESLVIHDLRIYMETLRGKIYNFHDNSTGREADAVLEFRDGQYALVEIKLGSDGIKDAISNLLKVKSLLTRPPVFMMVIVGVFPYYYYDKENGVYVVPLTSLKP